VQVVQELPTVMTVLLVHSLQQKVVVLEEIHCVELALLEVLAVAVEQ
jgi:hypothetical protein